jgi:hypothetical protein
MEEKGVPSKLAVENKIVGLQALIVNNELNMGMKKCWYQLIEFREISLNTYSP